jgi:hypothetical protein
LKIIAKYKSAGQNPKCVFVAATFIGNGTDTRLLHYMQEEVDGTEVFYMYLHRLGNSSIKRYFAMISRIYYCGAFKRKQRNLNWWSK